MTRAFHRGAAVALTFKGVRIEWDRSVSRPKCELYQHPTGTAHAACHIAAVSNPSRQRRKGPIVRFGSKS